MRRLLIFICFILLLCVPSAAQTHSFNLIFAPWSGLGEAKHIYALDVLTGDTEALLTVDTSKAAFRLSPTGDQLAYVVLDNQNPYAASLFVYDLHQREITFTLDRVDVAGRVSTEPVPPFWSPDGQTLAVSAFTNAGQGIALINGQDITWLMPQHQLNDVNPEWSTDSRMLLYHFWDTLTFEQHSFVTLDIQNAIPEREITNNPHAHWIPDTHDVLTYESSSEENITQLEQMNAETGEIVAMSVPLDSIAYLAFKDNETVYLVQNVPTLKVIALDLNTGESQQILSHDESLYYEQFLISPDAQYLAATTFSDHPSGTVHLYNLENGELLHSIRNSDEKRLYDWIWMGDDTLIFCAGDIFGNYSTYRATLNNPEPELLSDTIGGQILGWMDEG